MSTAAVIKWGSRVVGREEQAAEVFTEALGYLGELKAAGKVTDFEPFIQRTGSPGGFLVIKGEAHDVASVIDSDRFKMIQSKALYVVEDFGIEYLYAADEIPDVMMLGQKAYAELGLTR